MKAVDGMSVYSIVDGAPQRRTVRHNVLDPKSQDSAPTKISNRRYSLVVLRIGRRLDDPALVSRATLGAGAPDDERPILRGSCGSHQHTAVCNKGRE